MEKAPEREPEVRPRDEPEIPTHVFGATPPADQPVAESSSSPTSMFGSSTEAKTTARLPESAVASAGERDSAREARPSTSPSPPPAASSKPTRAAQPKKSHWGFLAQQLGLAPPDEPEEVAAPEATESSAVTPPPAPKTAFNSETQPAESAPESTSEPRAERSEPRAERREEERRPSRRRSRSGRGAGRGEPRASRETRATPEADEAPEDFEFVPTESAPSADSSLVSDWHEHAGDIATNVDEEIDLDESWTGPTRKRGTTADSSTMDDDSDEEIISSDDADESGDRQPRRRRRRRRRSGRRDPEVAPLDDLADDEGVIEEDAIDEVDDEVTGGVDEADEPEVARPPRSESRRRRDSRGSRRRPRRSDDDRPRGIPDRTSDVADDRFGADMDLDDPEAELENVDSDIDQDFEDEDVRPKHTKIPTWDQAIGALIDANLASRTRSPHGNGRGRGRGRGPRRN